MKMSRFVVIGAAVLVLAAGMWVNAGAAGTTTPRPAVIEYHRTSGCYTLSPGSRFANHSMEERLLTMQTINNREEHGCDR